MGSSFQQQSMRRKIIYTALIVCLFSVSLILRQSSSFGIEQQAEALEIRERNLGDVELTGSAIRLMLTGSSGLAQVVLWHAAQEMQKKHEWNDLEMIVNSITKLQPHFITPWLFQSWNLSYNVSVESDRIKDKYFYIARGILLLAEGERQNKGNPDLRFSMGFYNQHKIGLSDEANTLQCLYELSCMDPTERDPAHFFKQDRTGARVVDMAAFEQLCQSHPMLVRRLRETLKRDTPADIVAFLDENQKIPGRYVEGAASPSQERGSPLKPLERQFPCLPALTAEDERSKADPDVPGFGCFLVARDWYTYSNKPLPPPQPEYAGVQPPYDVRKYRVPKYMASIIFRGYPARGQTYDADHLEKEGWFDKDGWKMAGWFPGDKFQNGKEAVAGDGINWAERAWDKAFNMWQTHGRMSGLYLTPEDMRSLEDKAEKYRKRYGVPAIGKPQEPTSEDRAEYQESYEAIGLLYWYDRLRAMTNFPHFYHSAQVESDPKAIEVRKAFFLADQQRKAGDREQALLTYQEAMPKWREILLAHQDFRRDSEIQEGTFEIGIKYLDIFRELYDKPYRQILVLEDYLAQAASCSPVMISWLPPAMVYRRTPLGYATPFEGVDDDGELIVGEAARNRYKDRIGMLPGAQRVLPGDPMYKPPKPAKQRGRRSQERAAGSQAP
jgi:hypothetical protein